MSRAFSSVTCHVTLENVRDMAFKGANLPVWEPVTWHVTLKNARDMACKGANRPVWSEESRDMLFTYTPCRFHVTQESVRDMACKEADRSAWDPVTWVSTVVHAMSR